VIARTLAAVLSFVCLLPAQGQDPAVLDTKKKVRTVQVKGRVLAADGTVVAGVHMHIGDPLKVTTAEVLAQAAPVTGADGTFELPWTWDQSTPWNEHALLVAGKGFAAMRLWLMHQGVPEAGSARPLDVGDLVLDKGQRFVGRLRGADGKPVANALVSANDLVLERMGGQSLLVCVARSTDAGIFDLPCALPSGLALTVRADGHYQLRRQPVAAGTPLEIDLQPSGWIEGIVERDGKPVPNANLSVLFENGNSEEAKADANGAFRITVAHRGRWRVQAYVAQETTGWNGRSKLGEGAQKGVVVALKANSAEAVAGKLAVQAVTKGSGAPVPVFKAVVAWGEDPAQPWLRHNLESQLLNAKTAAGGSIELDGPADEGPAGVVLVVAKGHAPLLQKDVAWTKAQPTLKVELEPEATVAGIVRDPASGRPVAGAVVSAVMAGNPDFQPDPVAVAAEDLVRTAADGSFRLGELGEGDWLLHVRADGRPEGEPMPVTLKGQEARTGLVLDSPEGAVVGGKLVGEPIGAGWRVSLRAVGMSYNYYGGSRMFWGGGLNFFNGISVPQVAYGGMAQPVAADGSFRFTGVALGHYTLHLQRPASTRAAQVLELPIESFRVRAAGVQRDFDMAGDKVFALRGRVTFPAAATTPENLVVVAEPSGETEYWQHGGTPVGGRAMVTRDGTFAVAVTSGRYRLSVYDLQLGILLARTKAVAVKDADASQDIAVVLTAVTIECKAAAGTVAMAVFDRLELRAVLAADKELGNVVDLDDQYDMGTGLQLEPGATKVQFALPNGDYAVFARSQAARLRVKDEAPSGALGRVEIQVPGDGKTAFVLEVGPPPPIAEVDPVDEKGAPGKDDTPVETGR
jgi:hypothetical protein